MDPVKDWHSQYDSIFLHLPLRLTPSLLEILPIHSNEKKEWPNLKNLPQLSQLYSLLQTFLKDDRNWIGNLCNENELNSIQKQLNWIILNLQCEKHYGQQFWHNSKRQQASVVHFLLFIKSFILAIIPDDCDSIIQANSLAKLTIQIIKLETFMNEMLDLLKPVYKFMFQNNFYEEKALTKDLFKQINNLTYQLPSFDKRKLSNVPKLMEYICLCNQIQEQIQQAGSSGQLSQFSLSSFGVKQIKQKRAKNTLIKNINPESLLFFRFHQRVRRSTITRSKKKLTITTNETNRNGSSDKDRSPSQDRSITLFDSIKLKRQTVIQNAHILQMTPRRSRGLTSKSSNSKKSKSLKKSYHQLIEQDEEMERQQKLIQKKKQRLPIKLTKFSNQANIDVGCIRGWGIIRQYVNKKIAERKIRNLLFS